MGVTGLWKLIEQSGTPVPPETLENKILAVDVSIWLHQAVKGFQDSSGAALPHAHLLSLFSRVCKLLHYRIRPVFVFDGGVPYLKRETIRKRAQSKRQFRTQAERLQKLLAESVEREKLIQRALAKPGDNEPSTSSSESQPGPSTVLPTDAGRDAMFILPPLPETAEPTSSANSTGTSTDLNNSADSSSSACDIEMDEQTQRSEYHVDLTSLDVTGRQFLELPVDVRHEILTDLKALRKTSSWGRLQELPVQRDEFSEFQMRRLLKRCQVTRMLEKTEQEMGGGSMSLADIEQLLCEDGIVPMADSMASMAKQRVISDEHKRFLYVKSLKATLDEKKHKLKKGATVKGDNDGVDPGKPDVNAGPSSPKMIKLDVKKDPAIESAELTATVWNIENTDDESDEEQKPIIIDPPDDEDEAELQRAIQMSLEQDSDTNPFKEEKPVMLGGEFDEDLQKAIQLSLTQEPELACKTASDDEISSNADSDFLEVPDAADVSDCGFQPTQFVFEMNVAPPPDASMDFRHADLKLQVTIDPTLQPNAVDDLFADVFVPKPEPAESDQLKVVDETLPTQQDAIVAPPAPSPAKLDSILNRLNTEMQTLVKDKPEPSLPVADGEIIELDDNSEEETAPEAPMKMKQQDIAAFVTVTPSKSKTKNDANESNASTPPPFVKSPFFRKKTPKSSSGKKSGSGPTASADSSAKKALFPNEPPTHVMPPVKPVDLFASAASALRDATTADELAVMASSSRQTTRDLLLERNKQDRLGVSITDRMTDDCQHLLRMFGIPFVVAPMEAEAQCAYLNAAQLTDGTITDDSDIWLFGGRTVYRHFFDQDKRVKEYRADEVQRMFQVERNSLIQMAMLVGSDYTTGVPGIGTVTALEILSAFRSNAASAASSETDLLAAMCRFRDWLADRNVRTNRPLRNKLKNIVLSTDFPYAPIVQSYLQPDVRNDLESFSWRTPDAESLREFAKQTFGWTFARTDETLQPVLRRLQEKRSQQSIRNYFLTDGRVDRREVAVSKRVRKAIDQMARPVDEEETVDPEEPAKSEKPKRTRKTKRDAATAATASKAVPSTSSASMMSPSKPKVAKVPNLRPIAIRQRETELKEQKKRMEKAAEIFKQSQSSNAKKRGK